MIKKYNVSVPQKYMSNGAEKTYWANCGVMTEFVKEDGSISRILEIPAIGMKANIFPIEPKQPPVEPQPQQNQVEPTEAINVDDIPF